MNWVKCREAIICGINNLIARKQAAGKKRDLNEWKDTVLRKVEEKINGLRETMTVNKKHKFQRKLMLLEHWRPYTKTLSLYQLIRLATWLLLFAKSFMWKRRKERTK